MINCLCQLKESMTNTPPHSHVLADFGAYTNDDWVLGVGGSWDIQYGSGKAIHGLHISDLAQHCVCSIWLHCALAIEARRTSSSGSTSLLAFPRGPGKSSDRSFRDVEVLVGEPAND